MKKSITILFALCTLVALGQKKLTEKEVVEHSHINFSTESIIFSISGLIEIDGHTFKNDTLKCPIVYSSDLDNVSISDSCSKKIYVHRKCKIQGCKILHLSEIVDTGLHISYSLNTFEMPSDLKNILPGHNIPMPTNTPILLN